MNPMPSRELLEVRMVINLPSITLQDHYLVNIEGGAVKNLLLENVNIDLPWDRSSSPNRRCHQK